MALPVVDTEYLKEIDKARRNLRALIASRNCAPIMLRLAWHDAGTYDAKSKTGGPNGSIRNEEEYSHGSNSGLKKAIDWCEEVKSKHPKITYADLYQLAGVVAVEVTGGPTIAFVPGRKVHHISRTSFTGWVCLTRILLHYLEATLWEGHIQRDQVLMVLGLRSPSSLITHILWNFWRGNQRVSCNFQLTRLYWMILSSAIMSSCMQRTRMHSLEIMQNHIRNYQSSGLLQVPLVPRQLQRRAQY
ncbi:uncharacterized protein LOC122313335 isoform X2 [Carya illinoinensis]|uniref:uncharacterized protein LOC122313335 isoform X2 n=1 Tax=Carya illinoinensis TaxID=32201 RepID=UPI001C71D3AE|nr:uncharacterized protein LOC122313335 isoform X2 [Carya illinoinensis]